MDTRQGGNLGQLFEVTDAMIDAAAKVLWLSPTLQWSQGLAESVAEAVLLAASNPGRAHEQTLGYEMASSGMSPLFPVGSPQKDP